jgi:hypothetical protein
MRNATNRDQLKMSLRGMNSRGPGADAHDTHPKPPAPVAAPHGNGGHR